MAGPGICIMFLADTFAYKVHPVFNPVALYGYLLPPVYLLMAYITNPDLFVCGCRIWIWLDFNDYYEEQRQPSMGLPDRFTQKNGKSGPQENK